VSEPRIKDVVRRFEDVHGRALLLARDMRIGVNRLHTEPTAEELAADDDDIGAVDDAVFSNSTRNSSLVPSIAPW
jgi:hypothetical protein